LLWAALVTLLVVAQAALLWLTRQHEVNRRQEDADAAAAAAVAAVRQRLTTTTHQLQGMLWNEPDALTWERGAEYQLRDRPELLRLELRDEGMRVTRLRESPFHPGAFRSIPRSAMDADTQLACASARRRNAPAFSRTYFVPLAEGMGLEVVDLCVPRPPGSEAGAMVATIALSMTLENSLDSDLLRAHEISLIEADGTRLARAGVRRGNGHYVAERLLDVAGLTVPLRVDSTQGRPALVPNLATALVLGLSIALGVVVAMLARDVQRRARAERRLAEALAFRKAMEDSLVTGLRARDLNGRITYVNPAFCGMVGFSAEQLVGTIPPPYWPPEMVHEYTRRQQVRLAGDVPPREGFETTFMRASGERFPVLIFEAPLVDGEGRRTGWMSAVLDVSEQRRVEELSRQQQEKLQATARLATVGEMATLLSHELNQPLAAIASYATGSLNLLPANDGDAPVDPATQRMIRQAVERIAEQAERAGRVIRSVHQLVRRREQLRETLRADHLIEAVLPLMRLQARKSATRLEIDVESPAPRVTCDRTMVEQVLLNLVRNAIQAMDSAGTPMDQREVRVKVRPAAGRWVTVSVIDQGPGIPPEVGQQLFTPFFTTKPEGMGMGLALCRTVIEQHGGALEFVSPLGPQGGTEFRFTLPGSSTSQETSA
jgi:two-component system sensor histidine kinase DctS